MTALHIDHVLYRDQLPAECITDCCHQGDCLEDVQAWRKRLNLTVDRARAEACLLGYGAWDADDLALMDDDEIAERILWCACGNFREGSDIYVLE